MCCPYRLYCDCPAQPLGMVFPVVHAWLAAHSGRQCLVLGWQAEQAKNKIGGGLPLAAIGFNTTDLQKEVRAAHCI